ncbi:NAD(P)/FAD-dependent oxidoreductase [Granulicoccus phenolivorans]|uniref:NAD(P)/FAD-dependent oxidoreductase n=1 Tax=Granulicoccus phenolivorans TaxID=266854 RepID=UPI00040A101D|nr:FAD-dependent oxidoreductase [Granulicoccus phenolivorans]
MTGQILIAGAGEAGLAAAITLRELGYPGTVTLVGAEPEGPYQRPPLSKEFLTAATPPAIPELRAAQFYAEHRIDLVRGTGVRTATWTRTGGVAGLGDGRELPFDAMVLATGSVPLPLPVPGAGLPGIHRLRTLADAHALRDQLEHATRVVVVGGGFIGLEVAAAARTKGASVTVVEAADRLLARVVAEPVSRFVREHHAAAGIRFLLHTRVTGLVAADSAAGGPRVGSVVLATPTGEVRLAADLVVVGVGARPVTELAAHLGVTDERGIVVDAHARTADPRVVAAGDCTVQPHPRDPDRLIRLESVHNATEQGRQAAHSLLGKPHPPRGVPYFWSNQGELKLQIAGLSDDHDDLVVRTDADRCTVLYYRSGALIAADSVNHPRDHLTVKRALASAATIDPARAADPAAPLKTLVTPLR